MTTKKPSRHKKRRNKEITKSKLNKSLYTLTLVFIILIGFIILIVSAGNPIFTAFGNTTNVLKNDTYQDITFNFVNSDSTGLANVTGQIYENNISKLSLNYAFDTNLTQAYDYSGNDNNGTINNLNTKILWQTTNCKIGGCLNFSGSTGATNITVPFSQSLNFTNSSFSFEVWINPLNVTSAGTIFNTQGSGGINIEIKGASNPFIRLTLKNFANASLLDTTSTSAIPTNRYTYVAVVWNKSRAIIYVNGIAETTSGSLANSLYIDNRPFIIGMLSGSSAQRFWNGTIDNLRLWNISLSSQQVYQDYLDGSNNITISTWKSNNLIVNNTYRASLYVANGSDLGTQINTSEQLILDYKPSSFIINFSKSIKKINFDYGLNEKNNWYTFSRDAKDIIEGYHKNISSNYIRIWIGNFSSNGLDIMPYINKTTYITYNYSSLDVLVNAVLNSSAIPYITFECAPDTLSNQTSGKQKCNSNYAPENISDYALYVSNVTKYLSTQHNISTWKFTIWNEPDVSTNDFGSTTFSGNGPFLFNVLWDTVYNITKTNNPESHIGGPSFATDYVNLISCSDPCLTDKMSKFLSNISRQMNASIDFISYHDYGMQNSYTGSTFGTTDINNIMNFTYLNYYILPNKISNIINYYRPDLPIFIDEYNYHSTSDADAFNLIFQQFEASWYSSSLIWQLQSNLSGELFFQGTSTNSTWGTGLWSAVTSENYVPRPAYYMKKDFTAYNTNGSTIYNYSSPDTFLEVLPVKHLDGRRFITVINKYNQSWSNINLSIADSNLQNTILTNKNTTQQYNVVNGKVTFPMSPYEVSFYELNTPPTNPIINSPVNNTLIGVGQVFNISGGDDADADTLYYGIEIDDDPTFASINYYNGTLLRKNNGSNLYAPFTIAEGDYYIRTYSTDLASNSSYSGTNKYSSTSCPSGNCILQITYSSKQAVGSASYNATSKGLLGIFNISNQLSLLSTILVFTLIISAVIGIVYIMKKRS